MNLSYELRFTISGDMKDKDSRKYTQQLGPRNHNRDIDTFLDGVVEELCASNTSQCCMLISHGLFHYIKQNLLI